ncbi:MAG: phage minor head protein [Brevundimonas sp.]|uniref:phage minor head protein n=1 Tax=Brevundimonas sp. TaxID=1871086 RepID=UPI003001099A
MPTTRNQARLWQELADRYGPLIADAFIAAVDDLKSLAEIQRITAAIEAGDVEGAIEALRLDPASFDRLLEQVRQGYLEGGRTQAGLFPARKPDGTALIVRFDGRNLRAEAWLRDHSSDLITRIIQDQRLAVRAVLTKGMQAGRNPKRVALDIVGRISRVTGKREGGVLGLSSPQERAVASARAELTSGDPRALSEYLTRKRRDERFDRTITKAIRDGKSVPAEAVNKAITAYERRLLQLRGEVIGRTEAMTAIHSGQHEAVLQAVDQGEVAETDVRRVWRTASDARVRDTHRSLDADTAGLREPFVASSGSRMLYPGDTSLGAPSSETIGCRCTVETRIDFLANIR